MSTTELHTADLEPSLVFGRTYVTRRRHTYIDAATLLSLMVVLITMIPARLVVPGATDVGRPGVVIAFLVFSWWILVRFSSHLVMTGPQPLRWATLLFMVSLLVGYAVGFMRGLTSMESNAADRTMLFFCAFIGAVLTGADGVPNWYRLRRLLRVLVLCAALVATIAIVEYVFSYDVTQYMVIPGLQAKGWTPTFQVRGSGARVAATTTHYIELAAFLSLALPFAIHFACFSERPRRRRAALVATLLIATAILTTISRTGIVAVVLMFICLFPVWTWRLRYNILAMVVVLAGALTAVKPRLVRTLVNIFSGASQDSSVQARTSRYGLAFHYIAQRPWLGRGTGTWVAPQYQIMDNQWLDTLLANGIIGVLALAGLHITAIVLAWKAMRRSTSIEDRHLCAALISTQVIGLIVAGTFDSMSFLTYATILALTLGLCGTVWRLTHPARQIRTSTTRWFLDGVVPEATQAVPRPRVPAANGRR